MLLNANSSADITGAYEEALVPNVQALTSVYYSPYFGLSDLSVSVKLIHYVNLMMFLSQVFSPDFHQKTFAQI